MARFQRGDDTLELWLVRGGPSEDYDEPPSEIWSRRDDGEPQLRWRSPIRPDDEYRAMQRTLIAGGWARVVDPAREVVHPPVPHHAELDARLRDELAADTVAVWADWLGEHGAPLAAWLAHARVPLPAKPRRDAAADAKRVRADALAPLGPWLRPSAPASGGPYLEARVEHGLIAHAHVDGHLDRDDGTQLVWELLRHPLARYLRELAVVGTRSLDLRLLVDMVMTVAPAPPLRRFVVGAPAANRTWALVGELGALGDKFPALSEVQIAGDEVDLDGLALPRATVFRLWQPALRPAQLAILARAPWPELRELDLEIGGRGGVTATHVAAFFDGAVALPRLARVTLRGVPFADELARLLVASPVARQLEWLELRGSTVQPAVAAALRAAGVTLRVA